MNKTIINPWKWQDAMGFAQAIEVKNHTGTLYCAGQASMDADGKPVAGTMSEQIKLSLENVATVIKQAGYRASNVVRLNFYTTSIASFFEAYGTAIEWMQQHGCKAASTLLQVEALAFPELTIEIEVTVVN